MPQLQSSGYGHWLSVYLLVFLSLVIVVVLSLRTRSKSQAGHMDNTNCLFSNTCVCRYVCIHYTITELKIKINQKTVYCRKSGIYKMRMIVIKKRTVLNAPQWCGSPKTNKKQENKTLCV